MGQEKEREWDGRSRWESEVVRNSRGLGWPAQQGRRHRRKKIFSKISTLVGYVSEYRWLYGKEVGATDRG